MTTPPRRCQKQQDEDDKPVMKVTVESCKGERPSESVINVHIDGINPNANSPQIDKLMRRLTKNVVKIQNEIENQNNPNRKQPNSANDSLTDSDLQDLETIERTENNHPKATNTCERERRVSPACRQQNKGLPTKETLQNNLHKETNPQVKSNAVAKCTTSNTDIVEIYSNKLIKQSCDSVMNEWVSNFTSGGKPDPTQQLIRRKRSLSCNNIAAQRGQTVHVYQVNHPGTSRGKDDDGVGQEDTDTDDISLSTVSFGNKSTCSCCHHHLGALDTVHADGMPFGDTSNSTVVLSGKSSRSSAFNCCGAPEKRRGKTTTTTTTTTTSTGKKEAAKPEKIKNSSDGASTITDTSHDSNSESAKSAKGAPAKTASEKKRDSLSEKEVLEKQMALLSEKAKNEELSKKTEEQNKRISELNRKLDELFRTNTELSRANAEERRRKEEERWRMEGERQRELERKQADEAERLAKNYPGDGNNRRVRTMTKGNRTNIEAIEALLHNKLPKQAVRNEPQGASRRGEYSPKGPQRSQRLNGPSARGVGANEDRFPPREDFQSPRDREQYRPSGYSAYDPSRDFYDGSRGPGNRQDYDPSLNFSDRSRGPGNLETQGRRQHYDPSLHYSDGSQGPGYLETQGRRQEYDPSLNFSDRSRGPGNLGIQGRRQEYDPSLNFSDRSRGPENLEIQGRRQDYDPRFNFSDRSQGPGNLETQGKRQDSYQNHDFPRDVPQGFPENVRGPPKTPMRACERCGGSDQDVTFCCCFKKSTKPKVSSRPTSPHRPCQCCGQCPPRCICENGDVAPIALYQNVASLPDMPAQIGDAVYPLRELKSTEKTPLEGESEKSPDLIDAKAINDVGQMGDGRPITSTERLDKTHSLGNVANSISRPELDKTTSKAAGVSENTALRLRSGECNEQEGGQASPEIVQPNVDPQFDKEKKEMFVQKMLGCDCALEAQIGDGIHPSREFKSKENIPSAGGVAEIKATAVNGVQKPEPAKPKKRRNVFKYLCSCCNCTDSQQSMVNADGVLQCTSGECLDQAKSLGNGISRASLAKSKSKASSVGEKSVLGMRSCECNGQEKKEHTSPEGVQLNVDPHFDNENKDMFVQQKLGCDCEGQNDIQTVYEKFADEARKGQLIKTMMSCACEDSKIKDFPSEELIGFENYEEQYFDDAMGINAGRHGAHQADQRAEGEVQHSCACEGANAPKDLDGKRNLVERRLDRHGFGQRHDCEKKRALVQTRMGCVCNAEDTGETLKKQRILEDRLDCSCRPVGDPRKMGDYVRTSLGCGTQCDEHVARETRRKQAIVERRLYCSADRLRDTDKKSAYLKRRLDCICDDAGTQAKKQQAYLERFLTCGCSNVARDMQKKKRFVDDFLKCKCDKESEVKKMQLYLERSLSCDCEHIKERNMDKKIDYMNKVMSCDGPSCKAEKEGKELVTVCGDGKANVAEVTKRLPPNPLALGSSALGSDALLCSCGSGESYLGPCRCDSMSDVEKSSARRHRRGATSSVVGGLICRCGKKGDSECICDGAKERPVKPSAKPSKAKCVCRHRLDGICRCRGKAGRNMDPDAHRSYMVDQIPCKSATRETAKSVSDSILCSANKANCNCELDPESCFCSQGSSAKSDAEQEEGSAKVEETRMSDTDEEKSAAEEEDEAASIPEENQDEIDQIDEPPEVVPIEETKEEDGCVCKKNCSGKCKCDIDGSDCSQGKQAKRCYCDAEGPETCICAKMASPQLKTHAQGKCRCTKDRAGRCKCDLEDRGQHRSRSKSEESGTCHCRKDTSGQCKCDKVENKRSTTHNTGHSGVVIELKNINSRPEVSISGLETRKGNLKVKSSSPGDDGKEPDSQQHSTEHETQVYNVESHHNDVFVLKEPNFDEFSSESCPESADEMVNDNAFESPLNTSTSGYEFESPLNTSASDQELKSSPTTSPSCNSVQLPPKASERLGNDIECLSNKSASSNEFQDSINESTVHANSRRESSETIQDLQNPPHPQGPQELAASLVESPSTQSEPSSTEIKTGQVGPSLIEVQPVQVRPPETEVPATSVRSAPAGPSMVLGEGRRPKWYHMFHFSHGKSHKRRKRESEDSSG